MSKRIALVGHCGPDSSYLKMVVSRAAGSGASVVGADDDSELNKVLKDGIDLLLLNRELGYGFQETLGVDLIKRLRTTRPEIKLMLVSNYPEAQAAAIANGALPGFGKRDIGSPHVVQMIKDALGELKKD